MIYLARHGHTHNPEHLLYGNRPGFRLSRVGRWQAAQLGRRLASVRLAAVYSSPNDRAVETAWMATGRPPVMVPAFLDWEPDPDWVGMSWDDIPRLDPERWSEFRVKPWIDARPAVAVLRQLPPSTPAIRCSSSATRTPSAPSSTCSSLDLARGCATTPCPSARSAWSTRARGAWSRSGSLRRRRRGRRARCDAVLSEGRAGRGSSAGRSRGASRRLPVEGRQSD